MPEPIHSESPRRSIDIHPDDFRAAGHLLVDRIADFLARLPQGTVTANSEKEGIRNALGKHGVPKHGEPLSDLIQHTSDVLFEHSLFNGHPRFWGYITSSPAPIGVLGDMLAAAVNPNVASWQLAPVATEIEIQTIEWLAELIGYPVDCGGLLVSGGNMANFVGFLSARKATAKWPIREKGLRSGSGQLIVYVSAKTHTWIEKAADLFGLGTDSIRWIPVDDRERMIVSELEKALNKDRADGNVPFFVVGTAGTVGTGAIDPLEDIADVCEREDVWFHIDGAYGALAAMLPNAPEGLRSIHRADSVALDPHKWLYSPLEAGCVLVKHHNQLRDAFTFQPEYYTFGGASRDEKLNLFEYGMQNSRGFRALKVWLSLRQVGRLGFETMIGENIALAACLHERIKETPELEAVSCNLSITTFRYVPPQVDPTIPLTDKYLDDVNRRLLDRLQTEGEAFISNAVVNGAFVLRACIVNFRTTREDVNALPEIVVRTGRNVVKATDSE